MTVAMQAALVTVIAMISVALGGCSGSDARADLRKGAQSTPWGAPYANMPDIVPPQIRPDAYAALTEEQTGPPVDPLKGYRIESLGGGVYMVSDGGYNTMFVVSNAGVILVDAPQTMADKPLKAIQEVAPGAKVVGMVYSHSHIDHIGGAGAVLKAFPGIPIYAHEDTKSALVRAADPDRPIPTNTFTAIDVDFAVVTGNQTLHLRYPGPNHEPGNIAIFHPGQKVLMLVDVVYPGWMMWRRLGLATDIPGYFSLLKSMNARWDFDKLVAGHFRIGTKADVQAQLDFMTDMHNAITEAMTIQPYSDGRLSAADARNSWASARDWIDRLNNHCVNKLAPKWASRLAAFDVWIYDQCMALEQSIRVDGPSLK